MVPWAARIEGFSSCVYDIPVEVRCSGAGDLLLSRGGVEEHGLVLLRPGKVQVLVDTVSYNREKT